jgi:hypothetical protein
MVVYMMVHYSYRVETGAFLQILGMVQRNRKAKLCESSSGIIRLCIIRELQNSDLRACP